MEGPSLLLWEAKVNPLAVCSFTAHLVSIAPCTTIANPPAAAT